MLRIKVSENAFELPVSAGLCWSRSRDVLTPLESTSGSIKVQQSALFERLKRPNRLNRPPQQGAVIPGAHVAGQVSAASTVHRGGSPAGGRGSGGGALGLVGLGPFPFHTLERDATPQRSFTKRDRPTGRAEPTGSDRYCRDVRLRFRAGSGKRLALQYAVFIFG